MTRAAERRATAAFAAYQGLPEEVAARQSGARGAEGLREHRAIQQALERLRRALEEGRREERQNMGDFPTPSGDATTGVG